MAADTIFIDRVKNHLNTIAIEIELLKNWFISHIADSSDDCKIDHIKHLLTDLRFKREGLSKLTQEERTFIGV